MASNLVVRQHFVPKTYLKHFGIRIQKAYMINALPVDATEKTKIFEASTKSVAFEKHLYTLPGKTVEQKMAVERFYSDQLEQHYNDIYGILVDPNKNSITAQERELIISTVITMYYRTTKWVNASKNLMGRVFIQAFNLCQQTGKDYFTYEGEKISIKGKTLEQFTKEFSDERQPSMILVQLETAFKLIALRMQSDSICVIKLDEGNHEYITSDNPVIANNHDSPHFAPFDPKNLLRLPLDSKHTLMLVPECLEGQELTIFRNNTKGVLAEMEKLTANSSQTQHAEKHIFGSKSGLESYLDVKIESERPLKEGETTADIYRNLKKMGL
tara:strand:+ start:6258 stop:7241 length:984 start_codon:yes stop_codon:yes gene_type:complete